MTTNSPMFSVKRSCDSVISSVRDSYLNFSLQETPWSMYITIRKSFVKSDPYKFSSDQNNSNSENYVRETYDVKPIADKLKTAEDVNTTLKREYEEAINECEIAHNKIKDLELRLEECRGAHDHFQAKFEREIKQKNNLADKLQQEKDTLNKDLETAEKNWKTENQLSKGKEKEIHELKKENSKVSDLLAQVKAEFATYTSTVNKERKNEAKKLKKTERKVFLNDLKSDSNPADFKCNKCNKCDVNLESMQKLMSHVRIQHMFSKSVQSEEKEVDEKAVQCNCETIDENAAKEDFKKYKCFYCDVEIACEEQLNQHIEKCRGSTRMFGTAPLGLPNGIALEFSQPRKISPYTPLLWPYS